MQTLNDLTKVSLISLVLLGLVAATPQRYTKGTKTYLIEAEQKYNWYQAWNECAKENMQLFGVDSEMKNQELIQLLQTALGKSQNLWIDGIDAHAKPEDNTRPFYAMSTGKQLPYTYWYSGQPDNFKKMESCIHVWDWSALYQWNDNRCDTPTYGYVCEEKTVGNIQPITKTDDVHKMIEDMLQMNFQENVQPIPLAPIDAYKYHLPQNEKLADTAEETLPTGYWQVLTHGDSLMGLEQTSLDQDKEFKSFFENLGKRSTAVVKDFETLNEAVKTSSGKNMMVPNDLDWRYTVRNIQKRAQNEILEALLEQREAINELTL